MVQGTQRTTYGTFAHTPPANDLNTGRGQYNNTTRKVMAAFQQMGEKVHFNPDAIGRLMETMGTQSAKDLKAMFNRHGTYAETQPLLKK